VIIDPIILPPTCSQKVSIFEQKQTAHNPKSHNPAKFLNAKMGNSIRDINCQGLLKKLFFLTENVKEIEVSRETQGWLDQRGIFR